MCLSFPVHKQDLFFKDPFKQHKSRIPCVAFEGSCVVEEVSVQKLLLNDTQGHVSDRDGLGEVDKIRPPGEKGWNQDLTLKPLLQS